MRGSTRKRAGGWYAYWDLPPDPETGRRRQKAKGGFKRQKDAEAFLDEVLPQVRQGTYTEPSREPLVRYLQDEWLPAIRSTVRPLSLTAYEQHVRRVARFELGAIPLCSLTGGHLNAYYGQLELCADPDCDHDGDECHGLAVATRRLAHAVLRRALKDAVRWGKLVRNPADAADPPALPQSRVTAWTTGELRRFLEHVADDRLYAAWRLDACTGMRRGELAGLPWRFLDLDGGRLQIEQQLVPTRGGSTLGPPKRKRSRRTVALDGETVDALRRHRDVQLLERHLAGPAYEDDDLVFCDELGRAIHPQRFTEWFGQHRKAAGIPVGTLHVLRHTHATALLTAGVALHVVAARLGDDPKTVLSTYAHLLPHSDEEAAEVAASQLVDNPLTDPAGARAVEPDPAA